MSIIQDDGKREKRRPSLKGAVMQDLWRGQERVRSWPRKRSGKLHPKVKDQNEWFRQAQWATKYMPAEMYWQFAAAVQGTPLLPRDILTMMMAGRLAAFTMPDGRTIWSEQVMNDVSIALDVISDAPGAILVRGPDRWQALLPGEADQVLTSMGEGAVPQWQPGGGGGGGGAALSNIGVPDFRPNSGTAFGAGYFGGRSIFFPETVEVDAVAVYVATANGTSLVTPAIYSADASGNADALLASGAQVTGMARGFTLLPLSAPLLVNAGDCLWVGAQNLVTNLVCATVNAADTMFFPASGALPATASGVTYGAGSSMCFWAHVPPA